MKKIIALTLALVLAVSVCLTGCASESTYVMEAEYSDFGESVSNWQSVGFGLIGMDNRYSGGYKVQCLSTREGNILTWTFESSKATDAVLEILVITGGAYGAASTLTDEGVDIYVNGTRMTFDDLDLIAENNEENADPRGTIKLNVKLQKGTNTITYALSQSSYEGTTIGADIDCIRISTTAKLTYTEHTENLAKHCVGYEG